MICSKCGKIIKKENNMDWKDLDGSTPIEMLLSDNAIIERKIETQYYPIIKGDNRKKILVGLAEGVKYRYRLKPLEAIRITQDMADDLSEYVIKNGTVEEFYNRPVEIIEE